MAGGVTGLRHFSRAWRRWLMLAVVVALAARVLVPEGWMPVAGAGGVTLGLCDGGISPADMARAMAASEHRMKRAGVPMHHQGAPDHQCAFAGAAATADVPVLATAAVAPPAIASALVASLGVAAPGRGLAAPPPPSHAPPAFRA